MKSGFGMNNLLTAGNITGIKGHKELGICNGELKQLLLQLGVHKIPNY